MSNKAKFVEENYINSDGESGFIKRYDLPNEVHYTSGDGVFRNDQTLGKKYKMARFGKQFKTNRISYAWKRTITDEEWEKLKEDHKNLVFSNEKASSVQWIKFYGYAEEPIINQGINKDIKNKICENSCIVCGTTNNIECDHKNDCWMFNDSRIGEKNKQKLSDFQPLCKHCNDVKRQIKSKMIKENKRQPPPPSILLAFGIKFTKGDETFNIKNPEWGIGSYWYDPVQFIKYCIQIKMNSK